MSANPRQGGPQPALIDRCGDFLTQLCLAIAAGALICIVAINGANVVARYLFGSPFSWAEELMLFLMILSVFAGAVAVTWRNLHIRIDTFIDLVSPPVRKAALAIGAIVSIAVILTIVYASARIVGILHKLDQRSDALDLPSWIPQSFLTIGLAVIALLIGVRTVLEFTRSKPSAPPQGGELR